MSTLQTRHGDKYVMPQKRLSGKRGDAIKTQEAGAFTEASEFKHLIKHTCASCDREFDNTVTLYKQRGNYCEECSSEIANQVINNKTAAGEFMDLFKPNE